MIAHVGVPIKDRPLSWQLLSKHLFKIVHRLGEEGRWDAPNLNPRFVMKLPQSVTVVVSDEVVRVAFR